MAFAKTYETLWPDPGWHAEATSWIEERLAADGRAVAGEPTGDGLEDGLPLRLRKVLELCA